MSTSLNEICFLVAGGGARHPLLSGHPATWDALASQPDAVEQLPAGSTLLAGNELCPIQAAEIRHDDEITDPAHRQRGDLRSFIEAMVYRQPKAPTGSETMAA